MEHKALGSVGALVLACGLWVGIASAADAPAEPGPIDSFETSGGAVTPGVEFAAKVEVLGAAISYGGDYDMKVTTSVFIGGDRMDVFGGMLDAVGSNVNDGERHSYVFPATYDAGLEIRVGAQSWNKQSSGSSGDRSSHWEAYMTVWGAEESPQVLVLRDGDDVPDIDPFRDQSGIQDFVGDYVDADTGKITLESNQAIYLFELGTTKLSSSAADFQDLVVLVSLATDPSYFGLEPAREIDAPQPTDLFD